MRHSIQKFQPVLFRVKVQQRESRKANRVGKTIKTLNLMKEFSINIANGLPQSLFVNNRYCTTVDFFIELALGLPEHVRAIAVAEFRDQLGYEPNWRYLSGPESNYALPTNDVWRVLEDISDAHSRIVYALKAADNAAREELSRILPDGLYTVQHGVVKL